MSEQIAKANFDWVPFYKELAENLLSYKSRRAELLSRINRVFNDVHMSVPKLEEDGRPEDIDPFTFFGFFNRGITRDKRIRILASIKTSLG